MGKLVVFTDDPGWHGARLKKAFADKGFSSTYCSLTDCQLSINDGLFAVIIPGFEGTLPDGVFVRGVPGGTLDEVVFYLDILHALQRMGVPVYNDPRSIEKTVDKALTTFLLADAGIATPPTWVVRGRATALQIARRELEAGHELVAKPLFGSQGEGLQRFTCVDQIEQLSDNQGIYYLQRFISTGREYKDFRVFVIGGRAVAAMSRHGSSWLNNVAQGARCEFALLSEQTQQLAEAAVAAVGLKYGGVDIIRDLNDQEWVIEVNSIPAWKGLQSVIDADITELLAENFLQYCSCTQLESSCA